MPKKRLENIGRRHEAVAIGAELLKPQKFAFDASWNVWDVGDWNDSWPEDDGDGSNTGADIAFDMVGEEDRSGGPPQRIPTHVVGERIFAYDRQATSSNFNQRIRLV